MQILHNRISNKELRERMLSELEPRITVSFYRYFVLKNPQEFRDNLYQKLIKLKVVGRIYISSEGINAQISIPKSYFSTLRETLHTADSQLDDLRLNVALDNTRKSFWVLRMKVRPHIVADGIQDPTFNLAKIGRYVKAEEINVMIDDPDVLCVDMRNHYEYEVGHFRGAIKIPSNTFREQLSMVVTMLNSKKEKKILMYCTGGIRCEKASAWMLHNGFKNVYQMEGGIIEYVRRVKEKKLTLKFIGKNFVFDERLSERVTADIVAYCHQCGNPCDNHKNCYNQDCHLLFIQCSFCDKKYKSCCSLTCYKKITATL